MSTTKGMVFVVEDDGALRAALASLIRSAGLDVEVFGSASEFLARERPPMHGCLLLDMQLPDLSGLELQRVLAAAGEPLPIIFMSAHSDIRMTVRAMKAGAVEFLSKPVPDDDLLQAIDDALARQRLCMQQGAEITSIRARAASLTNRERQVMLKIVSGKPNKQVAAELGVSELTVKAHRRRVMQKMSATSFAELVRMSERVSRTHKGE